MFIVSRLLEAKEEWLKKLQVTGCKGTEAWYLLPETCDL